MERGGQDLVKIAFYHNHPSGGAARSLHELGRQLSLSHSIDVYALETADEAFLPSQDFASSVTVVPFRIRRPVRMGFYLNEMLRWLDLRRLDQVCREVAREIDCQDYDVAYADACRFVQAPSVLAYVTTPSVYYCHEPPRRFIHAACRPEASLRTTYQRLRSRLHEPASKLVERFVARLDRRNTASAGRLLCNSFHNRDTIATYYDLDATVCRLGVDSDRFRPKPGGYDSSQYVISVGALEAHKGFDFLIACLGRCPEPVRPKLVIVGNSDDAGLGRHLYELASRSNVRIKILVRVADDDLVSLYQGARAFVYGSHDEPFGLAVLEAMACGLPVVAVEEGGVPEIVLPEVNGLLCPRDEQIFAETLSRVLGDSHLAESMAREGRRLAETEWTWEAAAERVEAQLSSVARRTPEVVR